MNRVLGLLLLTFAWSVFHPETAAAQSAQETADWLQAKVQALQFKGGAPGANFQGENIQAAERYYSSGTVTGVPCAWDCRVRTYTSGAWGNITSISWARAKADTGDGQVQVIIAGRDFSYITVEEESAQPATTMTIYLRDVPDAEVERVMKALRHMATINGATIAKDDLF